MRRQGVRLASSRAHGLKARRSLRDHRLRTTRYSAALKAAVSKAESHLIQCKVNEARQLRAQQAKAADGLHTAQEGLFASLANIRKSPLPVACLITH